MKLHFGKRKKVALVFCVIVLVGLLLPSSMVIPVENAVSKDWNANSFWHEPWGQSVTHKGIDIFANKTAKVLSSTYGLVLFNDELKQGGKVVVVLGPKWRIHYYAHLDSIHISLFDWVAQADPLGTVGDSGNAAGKQPHLHYSIMTLIPFVWRIDTSTQGWKKAFYLDPDKHLSRNLSL